MTGYVGQLQRSLLGEPCAQGYGLGMLPSLRPAYPAGVARALHDLAERRLPWPEFERERERILRAA